MKEADDKNNGSVEEQYWALLDVIPDMIFIFDSNVRYVGYHGGKDAPIYIPPECFLANT